ncbi:MAG: ASPIC/UnbV domain-containing protein, partial [Anaerolineales bacterium]|nr:ASPIC/UnbV domain-containing protein [Anaerolineales bacterium]
VAINTIGRTAALLQTNDVSGNWLVVDLGGFYPGGRVELMLPDGRTLVREQHAGSSYLASEDPRLHFGLGDVDKVEKLWISWGNRRGLIVENVDSNQVLVVNPEEAQEVDWFSAASEVVNPAAVDNSVDSVDKPETTDLEGEMARAWFDLQMVIIEETPGFTPPVVSRALGYNGLVLYESIVHGYPNYQSLVGQVNGLEQLPLPDESADYHWPTVANTALAYMVRKMYPNMSGKNVALVRELEQHYNEAWAIEPDLFRRSAAYGTELAQALYVYSLADGGDGGHWRNFPGDYLPPSGAGMWEPTAPTFTAAMQPYWHLNRPFALPEPGACEPGPPIAYSEDPDSEFYAQAYEVYESVNNLTPEELEIATFWSDDPGETPTPPGHMLNVLTQVLAQEDASLITAAEAYARVGMAVSDAFIDIWYTKYKYNLIRPITYIQRVIDPDWNTPYITDPVLTPPFPEYTSGHSGQSGAAAAVLAHLFGDAYTFTDATHAARGFAPRTFNSFEEMALEAAMSRLYGGIHYPMSNLRGVEEGKCVGEYINQLQFEGR